jgi:riboflavin synthase
MFSGIIHHLGTVTAVSPRGNGVTVVISAPDLAGRDPLGLGDSIAIMGTCLTVEAMEGALLTFAMGKETMDCTTLGDLVPGMRVHLERALAVGQRLDGHIVSGHVDGVGTVTRVEQVAESRIIWIGTTAKLGRYIAAKGSITVDGVSLTVNEVDDGPHGARFRVNIIPFTVENTALGRYTAGSKVNLEVDLLARYVERLVTAPGEDGGTLTQARLAELGFGGRT